MKKNKFLIPVFLIALIVWGAVLIRQQKNIIQYQKEIKELSTKINVAQDELNQNKQNLEEEINKSNSPEYIEKIAREKLGMYLQNERVYVDSNK
ncbi:MAG: hypothetical protein BHV99_03270 [Clostridium sp. 26_21]|nr:MAG: hypothetical protein BHV99_03270 [Clostridium sp. 26_21]